jgi:hypothetical protein
VSSPKGTYSINTNVKTDSDVDIAVGAFRNPFLCLEEGRSLANWCSLCTLELVRNEPHLEIWSALRRLEADLKLIVEKDSEQDVAGLAIPVLDWLVDEARSFLGDDPLVLRLRDVISPEAFEGYSGHRASDILIVVGQLLSRVGMPESMTRVKFERSW